MFVQRFTRWFGSQEFSACKLEKFELDVWIDLVLVTTGMAYVGI